MARDQAAHSLAAWAEVDRAAGKFARAQDMDAAAARIEQLRHGLEDAYWRAKEHGLPAEGPSLSGIVDVLGYTPIRKGPS